MTASGYPIQLQMEGRLCVVVGSGRVGRRKACGLLEAGARVRLIDPQPAAGLDANPAVERLFRPYREGDLAGAWLAFAATDQRELNCRIAAEARARKIPVNIADDPQGSDFWLPAVLTRGDLSIAVATNGRSPALAAQLRDRLAETIGPEWQTLLEIAATLRQKRLTPQKKAEYSQKVLRQLLIGDLPELLAAGDAAGIDRLLTQVLGPGCSLAEMGINLPKGLP